MNWIWLAALSAMTPAFAGEFKNLGFDEASTNGTGISITDGRPTGHSWTPDLLPGWTLLKGTEQPPILSINEDPTVGTDSLLGDSQIFDLTQGKFALRLLRPTVGSPLWRLEQTGNVPAGVQYLVYRSEGMELRVEVSNQLLLPLQHQNSDGITNYSATATNMVYDISTVAGVEAKLAFVGPFPPKPQTVPPTGGVSFIDSIRFVTPSPELKIERVGASLNLSWPASAMGYVLQARDLSSTQAAWSKVLNPPIIGETEQHIEVGISGSGRIYQLGLE